MTLYAALSKEEDKSSHSGISKKDVVWDKLPHFSRIRGATLIRVQRIWGQGIRVCTASESGKAESDGKEVREMEGGESQG